MKQSIFLLTCLFLGACSPITIHTPTSYKGREATKPYVELPPQDTLLLGCDRQLNTCTASSEVVPHVHNPLPLDIEGQVVCKFEASSDKLESREKMRHSNLLKIPKRGSLRVSVRNAFEVPADKPTFLSTSCWLRYHVVGR